MGYKQGMCPFFKKSNRQKKPFDPMSQKVLAN
jgi:hypothetical protein